MEKDLLALQKKAGVIINGSLGFQLEDIAMDIELAMDAQPALVTTSNAGIPAFLSTYIDPALIKVLVAPMKAVAVVGNETKKGDWTTETAVFTMVESTGETSAYGDYSTSGQADANANFPHRQSFHYQTMTQWGEKQLATAGLAKINWANEQNIASVLTLNKYQNKTYFFGVENLQNYGLLNDPLLSTPLTPPNGAGGSPLWSLKTAVEIYDDIVSMFSTLQSQLNGLIDLDSPLTLAMSPVAQVSLTKTNEFKVNVKALIKESFPGIKVVTAPEYATGSGELVQLIADSVEGQQTATCAFTEKLRAHPIVIAESSFKQKKSQGTFGTIIFLPAAISQMLGV